MPAKRIIACLDVKNGRVVKGVRFEGFRDAGDPASRALQYCREGIDELVMLDVSATLEGRLASLQTVARIASEIDVPLTVGGGVRGEDDAIAILDAGADKVALNTAAVEQPTILQSLAWRYGSQCVVLSIDARRANDSYVVATRSATQTTGQDALQWARIGAALGAGEILLTAIDRDGTREGFDLALIADFSRALNVPLIASGGARNADSFADALAAGADAALAASVFHDGVLSVAAVKQRCRERAIEVRP
jgi:imidazoleglycerol phosphate synthase cyclase subunit